MIDRAWVSIGIRLAGLVGLVIALPQVASGFSVVWTLLQMPSQNPMMAIDYSQHYISAASGAVQLALCLYLLLYPTALASRWLRSLSGKCPQCLYDVRGLPGVICPECGGPLPSPDAALRAAPGDIPIPIPSPAPTDTAPKA